jgi:hypothetical protein
MSPTKNPKKSKKKSSLKKITKKIVNLKIVFFKKFLEFKWGSGGIRNKTLNLSSMQQTS